MENQKSAPKSSAQRTKEWRKREQERKQGLDKLGLVEIRLVVHKDQLPKLSDAAKMARKKTDLFLYILTQPAIRSAIKKVDDMYTKAELMGLDEFDVFVERHKEEIEMIAKAEKEGGDMDEAYKAAHDAIMRKGGFFHE
ncbi:MAG: hypothetical protein ACXV74_05155 [Methylobacter sp.]